MIAIKQGSDIDIVVKGSNVKPSIVSELDDLLNEESPLPYFFHVIHFESISYKTLNDTLIQMGNKYIAHNRNYCRIFPINGNRHNSC